MYNLDILIVEDESLVAMELADTINSLGYNVVEYTTNSATTKQFFKVFSADIIIMDINLRESIDGIDLYKSLDVDIPVIYLTAYKDEEYIAKAVGTNPIGYLLKPHNEDELKAILRLAFYKINHNGATVKKNEHLDIGNGYYFDKLQNQLFYNDIYISLTAKELQLLILLINARGSVVSFKAIENEIWAGKIVTNSSTRTLIYRLRGKMEYKFIENQFNYGIKL